LFVLGLTGLFLLNSWKRDFFDADEALFAEVCRGIEGGSWIIPELEGPYLDLPPLAFWLPAGLHKLTGLDPRIAYRIPTALAAALSLSLTYLLGRRLFDGRIGFLALLIQGSTAYFFVRASWLDDDLQFAAWTQLAMTSFALATRPTVKPFAAWIGWAGLGLAALTKSGLLAGVLVAATLILFLFFEGGLGAVRFGLKRLHVGSGIPIFLLITLPWFVLAAWRAGPELYSDHLVASHLRRIWGSPADAQPPYFYPVFLLGAFLPWTLVVPLGLLHGKDRLRRHGERLAFTWVVVALVLLTFASAKRPAYALVVWPPLAVLIAAGLFETKEWFTVWEDFLREGVFGIVPVLLKVPLALAVVAAGGYFGGYFAKIEDDRVQALLAQKEACIWALAIAGGAGAVLFLASGRVRKLVASKDVTRAAYELACASLLLFSAATFFFPAANPFGSSRDAIEKLAASIPDGARVAVYGQKRPQVFYYLGPGRKPFHLKRPDPDVMASSNQDFQAIDSHLKQPGPACLITSAAELEALRAQFASLTPHLNVRAAARTGFRDELVLVVNR